MRKHFLPILVVLVMLVCCLPTTLASASSKWTCPNPTCSAEKQTGKTCEVCGTKKPGKTKDSAGKLPNLTGLKVAATSQHSITLEWNAVKDAKFYTIEYRKSIAKTWISLTTVCRSLTATIDDLELNTAYDIRVRATHASKTSAWQTLTKVMTQDLEIKLRKLTGLTVVDVTENSISIDWDDSGDASEYAVFYKKSADTGWILSAYSLISSATIDGLAGGTLYDIRIRSLRDETASAWATLDKVKTVVPISADFVISEGVLTKYKGKSQDVTIPNVVTEIGADAFAGNTNIRKVSVPATVTRIGKNAFRKCKNLKTINIPDSVTSIGDAAFSECTSLQTIMVPATVTSLGANAFSGCKALTTAQIHAKISEISAGCFQGCSNLRYVEIDGYVTSIGSNAFNGCSLLENVDMSAKSYLNNIGEKAFYGCKKLSMAIPQNVSIIGDWAFCGCTNLTSLFFTNLSHLGSWTFSGCTGLVNVTFSPVMHHGTIGSYAFSSCINLKHVIFNEYDDCCHSKLSMGERIFQNCKNVTIHSWDANNTPVEYAQKNGIRYAVYHATER